MNSWSRLPGGRGTMNGRTLAFVIESQRRVVSHCEKLLAAGDLPPVARDRLSRLLSEAEGELRQLTRAEAA